MTLPCRIRFLPLQPYEITWQAMEAYTHHRSEETLDEIWLLQHLPVFTLGQNGKKENLLVPTNIPMVQTNRGGDMTYHGPGQLIAYILCDLKRKGWGIKDLVSALEESIISFLGEYNLLGYRIPKAPGVYIEDAKIASLGLRIRRHCSYHGLALNVAMDLTPFQWIRPCGIEGLAVTQLSSFLKDCSIDSIMPSFLRHLQENLDFHPFI